MPRATGNIQRKKASVPDQIDRIRDHIVNGTELTDTKDRTLARIAKTIWPIMVSELTLNATVKKIVDLGICGEPNARRYIYQTEQIYGRVQKADKDGRRAIMVEILMQQMHAASEAGDYKAVKLLVAEVAKLEGLYQDETNIGSIYEDLQLPAAVISDDPAILEGQQIEVDEDAGA